jgi:hypothetical protein
VCFAEAVGEGRRRCSLGTVVGVVERSGHSPALGSPVTIVEVGNLVMIVEEGSQGMLAEAVGRKLFCEHRVTSQHALQWTYRSCRQGVLVKKSVAAANTSIFGGAHEESIRLAKRHSGHS